MKIFKKIGAFGIIRIICLVIACAIIIPILSGLELLNVDGHFNIKSYICWVIYFYFFFAFISNILFSYKFTKGRTQELLVFFSSGVIVTYLVTFIIYMLIACKADFSKLDWLGNFKTIVMFEDWTFYFIFAGIYILYLVFYGLVIDRRIYNLLKPGLRGKGKLRQIDANLENSRWMTKEERDKIFKVNYYSHLKTVTKDGIPVMARLTPRNRDLKVAFNSPCHTIVIGSTGSGKTTTFVSPMIQLLAATKAGSSMVITDPKGELFGLHSKYLSERGYDVKVIDLRDTYQSYRWNPLEQIWDMYQSYLYCHKTDAFRRSGNVAASKLEITGNPKDYGREWYEFRGKAYASYESLITAVKVYKKRTFDEVYEDLNDLCSILIPVENEKDPMWEKGARSITLATLLAMLEDSADPDLEFTKEKFNFFNMAKILQNSSNDYEALRNYFKGRVPLSKALALSKQVCDAAPQTRASYMSIVYEKLTLFNDAGICALTSSSDFNSATLAEHPTALFLKIPDEKDTRHGLAAIFILNIYKTLIKIASARKDLCLPRNVYFIMDEFGNMPRIEKFDKFITVGRSRKIWFTMIVQSYSQLNNVYGENVANIIKGNCGIKMFIGSNDMNTCKEYSELCGNITVVTESTSGSAQSKDVNISSQTQVRPLIYPSELQRLNYPGNLGHSIIVTFGNYPFKTYFSPSFNVPFYVTGKMDTSGISERFFDENAVYYSCEKRNQIIFTRAQEAVKKAKNENNEEGEKNEK